MFKRRKSDQSAQNLIEIVKEDDELTIPTFETQDELNEDLSEPTQKAINTRKEDATCLAFMGASGGVGVTSLCVQMAYGLAQENEKKLSRVNRIKEPRICLIDLDFENGACAHHLDMLPALSFDDLIQNPNRIDRAYVAALMNTHDSGIDLLAAPNSLGGNDGVNPLTIVAMLDAVSQIYDHVILDVPRLWRPWNMAAIMGADRFGLVTDLTIPSLQIARKRIDEIEAKTGKQNCEIILNKHERRAFRNALREKDAHKVLKRDITATICADHDTVREAINCGEPAGSLRGESRYVKDVKALQNIWSKPTRAEHIKAA